MRILITGFAGFIGFHLTDKFINAGHTVWGIDNLNEYYEISLKYARLKQLGIEPDDFDQKNIVKSDKYQNFLCLRGDICDIQKLKHFFEKAQPDIVCHLAAQAGVRYSLENPRAYVDTNLTGFFNVLDMSRNFDIKHFIYASSSSVYGLNDKFPLQESDPVDHPVSLYAATKRSNELMAHTYSHLYKLPTTGLRFFTVYGPWGRPDMALIKFTKAIYAGETISLYNQGNMMRDFTYIDDVIASVYSIILQPFQENRILSAVKFDPSSSSAPFQIFNIGNSNPVRILEYIKELEIATQRKANVVLLPDELCELNTTWADSTKLEQYFQVKPNTPLNIGIQHFVKWFRQYYGIN